MMDWDRKFSTIVSETEANLDRVKRRLEAARNNVDPYIPPFSETYTSPVNTKIHSIATKPPYHQPVGDFLTASAKFNMAKSPNTHSTGPPIWATVLEEKIIKQQKNIDTLTEIVVSLQHEKESQKSHINTLKDALVELQDRLLEKGIDLDTETKIHQLKLQTSHEINDLKQQVRHYKQTDASNAAGILSMDDLRTQVREAKASCRDQTESARKELDYYKTRMTRLEKNINTLGDQVEDLSRRHVDLKKDVDEQAHRSKQEYRELATALSDNVMSINVARQQFTDLKADSKNAKRDSDVSKVQIAVTPPVDSSHIGRDKPGVLRAPAQWRDLLTHSLSSISVESNDSNLSSGYLARKRSQDSRQSAQDGVIAIKQPRAVHPTVLYYQTDKPFLFIILIWISYILAIVLLCKAAKYTIDQLPSIPVPTNPVL